MIKRLLNGREELDLIPIGRAGGNGGGANRSGNSFFTPANNFFDAPPGTLYSLKSSYVISAKAAPSIFSFTRLFASLSSTCTSSRAHFLTRAIFQERAATNESHQKSTLKRSRSRSRGREQNTIVCRSNRRWWSKWCWCRNWRQCRLSSSFLLWAFL